MQLSVLYSVDLVCRDWETPPTRLGKLMIGGGERAAGKQVVVWWREDCVRCCGDGSCLTAWQQGHMLYVWVSSPMEWHRCSAFNCSKDRLVYTAGSYKWAPKYRIQTVMIVENFSKNGLFASRTDWWDHPRRRCARSPRVTRGGGGGQGGRRRPGPVTPVAGKSFSAT